MARVIDVVGCVVGVFEGTGGNDGPGPYYDEDY